MATNALAPRPKNAMVRQADPLQSLLRESAEYPQYGELVDYLSARRMMPPVSLGGTASGGGVFERNSFFGNALPKTGVVRIGYGAGPSTLVHELTHAADNQISAQYFELRNKRGNLTPEEQQFMQAYEKLSYSTRRNPDESFGREGLARKLDPEWAKREREYRASNVELPAWGMGSTIDPRRDYDQPLHLDPTMASEFSILLDMANRLQKSKPVTDKR